MKDDDWVKITVPGFFDTVTIGSRQLLMTRFYRDWLTAYVGEPNKCWKESDDLVSGDKYHYMLKKFIKVKKIERDLNRAVIIYVLKNGTEYPPK